MDVAHERGADARAADGSGVAGETESDLDEEQGTDDESDDLVRIVVILGLGGKSQFDVSCLKIFDM